MGCGASNSLVPVAEPEALKAAKQGNLEVLQQMIADDPQVVGQRDAVSQSSCTLYAEPHR